MEKKDVILTVNGMDKSFGAAKALKNVGIEIYRRRDSRIDWGKRLGQIHSVLHYRRGQNAMKDNGNTGGRTGRQYFRPKRPESYGRTGTKIHWKTFRSRKTFLSEKGEVQSGPIVNSGKMNQ